jgi:uncharacterized protein
MVLSPSDLNAFLACPHLTTLQLAVADGDLGKPFRINLHADLIQRKGEEHERRYLEQLRADGKTVAEPPTAADTEEAIRGADADVIYQAQFEHDGWVGIADFLERLPDGSYEVVDTKLARHARPEHVLQLCFYTEQLARIQSREPELMHVVTGLGERETFRPDDYGAYYRRLRERFVQAIEDGAPTYPYPVEHCSLCDFLELCEKQWEEDDHLTLVAGVSRLQVERLTKADIQTLTALAEADPEMKVPSMRATTFQGLRHQASLQQHYRQTHEHKIDLLPQEEERGFNLMPEPSPGDIWLDFEGNAYDRAEPKRLGDGQRAIDEEVVRRNEGQLDTLFRELAESDHRLQGGDAPAGDHNAQFRVWRHYDQRRRTACPLHPSPCGSLLRETRKRNGPPGSGPFAF